MDGRTKTRLKTWVVVGSVPYYFILARYRVRDREALNAVPKINLLESPTYSTGFKNK